MAIERVVAELAQRVESRYFGKYRAFVVDNADPEKLGRLKLQVPSVLGEDVVTGWALPCVPYGGKENLGLVFIPEKDAGVWVEFEEGDLEFPIWVGTFWSKPGGETETPVTVDKDGEDSDVSDPPTCKIIKTASGHTIQFEDDTGNEMITIFEAAHKHIIALNQDGIKIPDGANDHTITLNSEGVTIESAGNMTFTGQDIYVTASGQLTLEGSTIHLNP